MIIYQIPAVMNQIFVNLHIKPQKISTDTILFNTSKFAISRYVGYNCFNSNIYSKIERIQENLSDNPFAYRLFFCFWWIIKMFSFIQWKKNQRSIAHNPAPMENRRWIIKLNYFIRNYDECKKMWIFRKTCYNTNHRTITRISQRSFLQNWTLNVFRRRNRRI